MCVHRRTAEAATKSSEKHTAATRQQQCHTSPLHTCAPSRTPSYKNQASRCACSTLQLTGDLFLHSYKCSNSEFVRPSPQRVERVPLHIRIYGLAGHWALLLRTGAAGAATGLPRGTGPERMPPRARERHPGRAFRAAKSRNSRNALPCTMHAGLVIAGVTPPDACLQQRRLTRCCWRRITTPSWHGRHPARANTLGFCPAASGGIGRCTTSDQHHTVVHSAWAPSPASMLAIAKAASFLSVSVGIGCLSAATLRQPGCHGGQPDDRRARAPGPLVFAQFPVDAPACHAQRGPARAARAARACGRGRLTRSTGPSR